MGKTQSKRYVQRPEGALEMSFLSSDARRRAGGTQGALNLAHSLRHPFAQSSSSFESEPMRQAELPSLSSPRAEPLAAPSDDILSEHEQSMAKAEEAAGSSSPVQPKEKGNPTAPQKGKGKTSPAPWPLPEKGAKGSGRNGATSSSSAASEGIQPVAAASKGKGKQSAPSSEPSVREGSEEAASTIKGKGKQPTSSSLQDTSRDGKGSAGAAPPKGKGKGPPPPQGSGNGPPSPSSATKGKGKAKSGPAPVVDAAEDFDSWTSFPDDEGLLIDKPLYGDVSGLRIGSSDISSSNNSSSLQELKGQEKERLFRSFLKLLWPFYLRACNLPFKDMKKLESALSHAWNAAVAHRNSEDLYLMHVYESGAPFISDEKLEYLTGQKREEVSYLGPALWAFVQRERGWETARKALLDCLMILRKTSWPSQKGSAHAIGLESPSGTSNFQKKLRTQAAERTKTTLGDHASFSCRKVQETEEELRPVNEVVFFDEGVKTLSKGLENILRARVRQATTSDSVARNVSARRAEPKVPLHVILSYLLCEGSSVDTASCALRCPHTEAASSINGEGKTVSPVQIAVSTVLGKTRLGEFLVFLRDYIASCQAAKSFPQEKKKLLDALVRKMGRLLPDAAAHAPVDTENVMDANLILFQAWYDCTSSSRSEEADDLVRSAAGFVAEKLLPDPLKSTAATSTPGAKKQAYLALIQDVQQTDEELRKSIVEDLRRYRSSTPGIDKALCSLLLFWLHAPRVQAKLDAAEAKARLLATTLKVSECQRLLGVSRDPLTAVETRVIAQGLRTILALKEALKSPSTFYCP